jgi:hypothetical protein
VAPSPKAQDQELRVPEPTFSLQAESKVRIVPAPGNSAPSSWKQAVSGFAGTTIEMLS